MIRILYSFWILYSGENLPQFAAIIRSLRSDGDGKTCETIGIICSVKFAPDYLNIVRYVRRLKEHHGEDILILLERFFFIDSEFFAICLVKFSMKSLTYCLLHGTIIVEISYDNLGNFSMEV